MSSDRADTVSDFSGQPPEVRVRSGDCYIRGDFRTTTWTLDPDITLHRSISNHKLERPGADTALTIIHIYPFTLSRDLLIEEAVIGRYEVSLPVEQRAYTRSECGQWMRTVD